MTNDELLAGYLERTLSKEQQLEFEAKRAADPSFAAEAGDMLTVESLLTESAPQAIPPVGFLSSVEASVVAKLAIGTAGAIGVGHLLTNVWAWVAGVGAVAVGGTAVYLTMNTSKPAEQPTRVVPAHHTISTPTVSKPALSNPVAEPTTQPHVNQVAPTHVPPQARTQDQPATDKSATAATNSPSSALTSLEAEYAQCSTQHQDIQCAQIALQLGQQFNMRGNTSKAKEYYTAALQHARTAKLVQYQVTALGSLGLVAKDASNSAEARTKLSAAVELAKANGLEYIEYATALATLQ